MRRRSFIATIPAAAAATARLTSDALAHRQNAATNSSAQDHPLPKFQPEADDKFIRPDVHAGDRPAAPPPPATPPRRPAPPAAPPQWAAPAQPAPRILLPRSPQSKLSSAGAP